MVQPKYELRLQRDGAAKVWIAAAGVKLPPYDSISGAEVGTIPKSKMTMMEVKFGCRY